MYQIPCMESNYGRSILTVYPPVLQAVGGEVMRGGSNGAGGGGT